MAKKKGFTGGFLDTYKDAANSAMLQTMRQLAEEPERKRREEDRGLANQERQRRDAERADAQRRQDAADTAAARADAGGYGKDAEAKLDMENKRMLLEDRKRRAAMRPDAELKKEDSKLFDMAVREASKASDYQYLNRAQRTEAYNEAFSALKASRSGEAPSAKKTDTSAKRINVTIGDQEGSILESEFDPKTMKRVGR